MWDSKIRTTLSTLLIALVCSHLVLFALLPMPAHDLFIVVVFIIFASLFILLGPASYLEIQDVSGGIYLPLGILGLVLLMLPYFLWLDKRSIYPFIAIGLWVAMGTYFAYWSLLMSI